MILIVDDKQENIFSLKSLLEINKFNVDAATSGEEALKKILKNSYALIVLDVQMPGMDGFEVAEAISGYSKAKNIPIIFLSAVNIEKKFITKGYASGGLDYITKPVDPDILLLKVKTFYRLYEQTVELTKIHKTLREEIEFRKKAEGELYQRVQELRGILEAIPHIAFTAKANGKIEFVNAHWFDYAEQEEVFPATPPEDPSLELCFENALMGKEPMVEEVKIRHLIDNEFRFHLFTMTPITKDNVIVRWVGTLTDIHEQKTATALLEQRVAERTRELQEINTQLEISNHDLQQFASVASHDLKEPLRKIRIFSSIIKEKFLLPEGEGNSYIDRIINASERMGSLINDLLDYSTLSVTELFRVVDLNEVLVEILMDLELTIKEKKAVLEVGELPELEVIPAQIRQVFQNILSNALKFSKDGLPPHISISAERVAEKSADSPASPSGNYYKILVKDNGIGFNEKYVDKIFTIFQRLNSKAQYEGTGIGLAIVKRIVDKHNGLITAISKENEGATFIIVLPIKQFNQR